MRIGIIGESGADYFADNVGDAFDRAGHVVTQLGPARRQAGFRWQALAESLVRQGFPDLDERAQGRISAAALRAGCELVVSLDSRLMPGPVARLKRAGVKVAFWFPDAVSNLGRQQMLLTPYDAIFFKEPHIVERLRATTDLPVHYLPQGFNPRWHRPLTAAGTQPYLVIAGNMYPSRVKLLERLLDKGIPIRLFGDGFPRWLGDSPVRKVHTGRFLAREEKALVFRSAAGVLNTMPPAEISGINSRIFEAAGCGAAIVTEYRPTLPDLFEIGSELLVFNDFDELISQATRLLSETGLTGRLGDAAARRAAADHSYDSRIGLLLDQVL